MQDVSQGRERARSWPRKRGKSRSPVTKAQNDLFRDQQRAAKYMAPEMLATFLRASEETPFLPRDLSTMMLANRLAIIHMADGRKVYPVPTRNGVSESLDALGQTPGMTLIRKADIWAAEVPATANLAGMSIKRSSALGYSSPNGWKNITFDTEVIQQGAWWNPASPGQFVADISTWYQIGFHCTCNRSGGRYQSIQILKNGAFMTGIGGQDSSSIAARLQVAGPFYLQAGDVITLQAWMSGSGQSYGDIEMNWTRS